MEARLSPASERQFDSRLTNRMKIEVLDALERFRDNPLDHDLRNHRLTGRWQGYRSISVGGDLRLHYQELEGSIAYFVAIGTHEQLYRRPA